MGKFTVSSFVRDQWSTQKPVVKVDLTGKTVVVVGANTGLGLEATKHFASMNPGRLVLACRSQQRGEAALKKVQEATNYKAELSLVDLSSYSSIKDFAQRWSGRLDILVMNAAVFFSEHQVTEGWETSLKVNHLGIALMSLLLLPHMKATADQHGVVPRLVVVSSDMHFTTTIPSPLADNKDAQILQGLNTEEYSTPSAMSVRYPLSKLLNVYFVRALNEHVCKAPFPIVVCAINPGYCYSELRKGMSTMATIVDWLMERTLALTTEEGSRQLVWGAVAGEEAPLRGGYVSFCGTKEVSDYVLSETGAECQERIWRETIDILSGVDPKVRDIAHGRF